MHGENGRLQAHHSHMAIENQTSQFLIAPNIVNVNRKRGRPQTRDCVTNMIVGKICDTCMQSRVCGRLGAPRHARSLFTSPTAIHALCIGVHQTTVLFNLLYTHLKGLPSATNTEQTWVIKGQQIEYVSSGEL